jgi:hypothetical protein
MDPSIIVTALERALSMADGYLKKASAAKTANVEACLNYLMAAQTVISGLEEEVDEILIHAKIVARFKWDDRAILFERIDRYLNRDRLRPILDQSLHGVEACRKFLERDATGFFQRTEKLELVVEVSGLLDSLYAYLQSLDGAMSYSRENYAGPSGINMPELIELQNLLVTPSEAADMIKLVETVQAQRQRSGFALVAQTSRLIQELTVVFQLPKSSGA